MLNFNHISINHSIQNKFYDGVSLKTITDTQSNIIHNLKVSSVDFEGKDLDVSLLPSIIFQDELERVSNKGRLIRKALCSIINQFMLEEEHGPIHNFFRPYQKWWRLIKEEQRTLPHISLMRYDAIKNRLGDWTFLETNSACPGGVIHCSSIRNAWLMTRLGHKLTTGYSLVEYPIDSEEGFLAFLYQNACIISNNENPNIAICSYKDTYKHEVGSLSKKFAEMRSVGRIPAGNLYTCDIREISYDNDQTILGGQKISLIYNKLDPLMIDPSEKSIDGVD